MFFSLNTSVPRLVYLPVTSAGKKCGSELNAVLETCHFKLPISPVLSKFLPKVVATLCAILRFYWVNDPGSLSVSAAGRSAISAHAFFSTRALFQHQPAKAHGLLSRHRKQIIVAANVCRLAGTNALLGAAAAAKLKEMMSSGSPWNTRVRHRRCCLVSCPSDCVPEQEALLRNLF